MDWLFQPHLHDAAYEPGTSIKPLEGDEFSFVTHEATGTIFKLMPDCFCQPDSLSAVATPRCVGVSFLEIPVRQREPALDAQQFQHHDLTTYRQFSFCVHRLLRRV